MKVYDFDELGVTASFNTRTLTGIARNVQSQMLTDVHSEVINRHNPDTMDVVTSVTHTKQVSFRFEYTNGRQEQYTLNNVDIASGDKVTLVFASSTGKTTGYIIGYKNHNIDKVGNVLVNANNFDFSAGGKWLTVFFRFVAFMIGAAIYGKGKGEHIAWAFFYWCVFEYVWSNWIYTPRMMKKYLGFFSDLVIKSLRHDAHKILQDLKTFRLRENPPKEKKEEVPA